MKARWRVLLKLLIGGIISTVIFGCNPAEPNQSDTIPEEVKAPNSKLFEALAASKSGIKFSNDIVENEKVNFYRFQYLYNGGGVGIGDINNDGLPDVYFTGNLVADKLYLNKGNLEFEDISESSGIGQFIGWKNGVSMVDINEDGWLDIYVCRGGGYNEPMVRKNLLFINQSNNTFIEMGEQYGLADAGWSVQAAFLDYDKDGDLDMYLTNHPNLFRQKYNQRMEAMKNPSDFVRDKLYRNEGKNSFREVSKKAGIFNYGHGLGLAISDYNGDGWPDIYVANDFVSPDFYYENNRDGTFTEKLAERFKHVSYFSMGCDVADLNNDGEQDLFVVEMLADDNRRQKTNMASMNPDLFWHLVDNGFHYQFMRNTLQINNGGGSFSEVAYLAGLQQTDWSWGPLLADFDNDGDKDVVITNGYLKDTQDKDFVKKVNEIAYQNQGKLPFNQVKDIMPSTRIKNYAFRNEGDLNFTEISSQWGFDFNGFSNGIAYGDLDNDGDLDLVVSNINDVASVYRNTSSEEKRGNYLRIKLLGPQGNRSAFGAKVTIESNGEKQVMENQVVRGFQSSCENVLHFGLKENATNISVEVNWGNGEKSVLESTKPKQMILLSYDKSEKFRIEAKSNNESQLFTDITSQSGVQFRHTENEYDDYAKEILLPHKQSQNGPKIAVGDINEDGMDDFYIGGAAGQPGALYVQKSPGKFKPTTSKPWALDAASEDISALFFDADGDGDLDLYVVSGGNEFSQGSPLLQDRLYLNNGNLNFSKDENALPNIPTSGGVAIASDIDSDGDMDLFVGGRLTPGQYPIAPRSYILENEDGFFSDITSKVAPDLMNPGLITTASWVDFDGDGKEDLVIAGEWTSLLFFKNQEGILINKTTDFGMDQYSGWWNKLLAIDIDGDGDMDFIAGNLGKNYKYSASQNEPFHIYSDDFDNSGSLDIVLGYYDNGTCYPVRGRQCSSEQMPGIAEKFPTYEAFGNATLNDVYGNKLGEALHYKATTFASVVLENKGNGNFEVSELSTQAQYAPVNGIIAHDFNADGIQDLLIAGNMYWAEVETGRADAGTGLMLAGEEGGTFLPIRISESGFLADKDVKDLALLRTGAGNAPIVLVANNDDRLQLFQLSAKSGIVFEP